MVALLKDKYRVEGIKYKVLSTKYRVYMNTLYLILNTLYLLLLRHQQMNVFNQCLDFNLTFVGKEHEQRQKRYSFI